MKELKPILAISVIFLISSLLLADESDVQRVQDELVRMDVTGKWEAAKKTQEPIVLSKAETKVLEAAAVIWGKSFPFNNRENFVFNRAMDLAVQAELPSVVDMLKSLAADAKAPPARRIEAVGRLGWRDQSLVPLYTKLSSSDDAPYGVRSAALAMLGTIASDEAIKSLKDVASRRPGDTTLLKVAKRDLEAADLIRIARNTGAEWAKREKALKSLAEFELPWIEEVFRGIISAEQDSKLSDKMKGIWSGAEKVRFEARNKEMVPIPPPSD